MKKIFAILIMLVFIASTFGIISYAHEDDEDDIREKMMENRMLIKINDKYEDEDDFDEDKRELRQEKIEKIKLESDANKNRIKNIKLEFEDSKLKFKNTREKLIQCRSKRSDFCKNINQESIADARTFLIKASELIIEELKKIRLSIESSTDLTDEEVKESLEEIDETIKEIEEIKLRLESTQSREEVIKASKDLKEALEDTKIKVKIHVEKQRHARVGVIIERAEHLELKLNKILSKFSEQNNTNTSELQSLIDQFHSKIDQARDKYYKAQDLFDQAKEIRANATKEDKKQAHELVREAHQNLIEGQKLLQDAHKILQQIFRIVKGINPKELDDDKEEDCWQDRPSYIAGKDLGFFIWQSNCDDATWVIEWSGDQKNSNVTNATMHSINGTIMVSNGTLFKVRSKLFGSRDKFELLDNGTKITFTAKVGPHFDGLSFKSSAEKLTFDLYLDNEHKTEFVFIGKNVTHPSSIPFELTGQVAEP